MLHGSLAGAECLLSSLSPIVPALRCALQDLEIPADVAAEVAASAAAGDSAQFVAPTPGVSAVHRWQSKCSLAADQAAAGAFDTAMRLLTRWVPALLLGRAAFKQLCLQPPSQHACLLALCATHSPAPCALPPHSPARSPLRPLPAPLCPLPCRQAGIVNFEPLKPFFMEVFQGSQAVLPALPGLPSLATALDRAWSADAAKQEPTAPALVSCSPVLFSGLAGCGAGGL